MIKSLITTFILLLPLSSTIYKREIKQNGFKITCFVSNKKIKKTNANKIYFWFKAGEIHSSKGNVGGKVLDNNYIKFNKKNNLIEKGAFKLGLKDGDWTSWYKNGNIKNRVLWEKGVKNGYFFSYLSNGKLDKTGFYKKNNKNKTWINHLKKDTLFYNNGVILKKKEKFIEKLLNKIKRK